MSYWYTHPHLSSINVSGDKKFLTYSIDNKFIKFILYDFNEHIGTIDGIIHYYFVMKPNNLLTIYHHEMGII